jgi:hypothetical protein
MNERNLLEPVGKVHGDAQTEMKRSPDEDVVVALLRRGHVQTEKLESARRCPLNVPQHHCRENGLARSAREGGPDLCVCVYMYS